MKKAESGWNKNMEALMKLHGLLGEYENYYSNFLIELTTIIGVETKQKYIHYTIRICTFMYKCTALCGCKAYNNLKVLQHITKYIKGFLYAPVLKLEKVHVDTVRAMATSPLV